MLSCRPQVPLPEEIQVSPGDTEIHRVEPEDVANHLTAFHWELFRCVHEVSPPGGVGALQLCPAEVRRRPPGRVVRPGIQLSVIKRLPGKLQDP